MTVKGMKAEDLRIWGERVSAAVEKSLVEHMTHARL